MYIGLGSKNKVLDEFETLKRSTLWKAGTHCDPKYSGPEESKEAATETRALGFHPEGDLQPQAKRGHCSFKRIPRKLKRGQDLCFSKTRLTGELFPQVSIKRKRKCYCSATSDSLRLHGLQPARLLRPWDFPGKSTDVSSHSLLPGIFLTQGSNPGLLHCRHSLDHPSHQGSPKSL